MKMEKVYRYMSLSEFSDMLKGLPIKSETNWKMKEKSSSSIGICFLPESIVAYTDRGIETYDPIFAYEFLSGIVSNERLVEFENHGVRFEKTSGVYADPFGSWWARIEVGELSTTMYNRDLLIPIRYRIPGGGKRWVPIR